MIGTVISTIKASFKLVMSIITNPPKNKRTLLKAIEIENPKMDCNNVVSVVKRAFISPLRFISK